jgi:peptidoglycan hydrolase CwlO-like protein
MGVKFLNESQKIKLSLIGIVFLLILATVYVFWVPASDRGTVPEVTVHQSETGRNIRDAEQRAESVGESIDRATESVGRVQNGIDESSRRAKEVQESIGRTKALIEESRRLSEESRTILEGLPKVDDK